jgi:hypothetical protein
MGASAFFFVFSQQTPKKITQKSFFRSNTVIIRQFDLSPKFVRPLLMSAMPCSGSIHPPERFSATN